MRTWNNDEMEETEAGIMMGVLGHWSTWQPAAWKQCGITKGPWTWPF